MQKQQQKQLLLKQLQNRNYQNSQIIRKYIRKMANFHKRLNLTSIVIEESKEDIITEKWNKENSQQQLGGSGELKDKEQPLDNSDKRELAGTEIQKVSDYMDQQQKEIRNKECLENQQKEKISFKLPSINCHIKQPPPTVLLSPNRNLGIKSQISMSINPISCGSFPVPSQKRQKVSTETTQPNRYTDEKPCTFQTKQIKNLWKPNLQSFTQPQPQPQVHIYRNGQSSSCNKKQSGSHKALLNLQEIVFEEGTKKGSKGNRQEFKESRDVKRGHARVKGSYRDGDKLKKQKEKQDKENVVDLCYSYHADGTRRLTTLDGLQNLANVLGNSNPTNNQYESISISALTYIKGTIARNSTQAITSLPSSHQNPNSSTHHQNESPCIFPSAPLYPSLAPHFTNTSLQKQAKDPQIAEKQAQKYQFQSQKNRNLPQLRKIKELRFNIQKCRKQYNGSYTNIRSCINSGTQNNSNSVGNTYTCVSNSNQAIAHNNGGSASTSTHNNNHHNHSYSSGVAEVFNSPEVGANVFRIQALPLHQIKWI